MDAQAVRLFTFILPMTTLRFYFGTERAAPPEYPH
jgi:hypothetical protein